VKQELLYDGDCPMCKGAADWLSSRTGVELTPLQTFVDAGNVTSATPTQALLLEQIHLRDKSGNFVAGAKAIAISLTTSPRWYWRVIGNGMQIPGVDAVADWVYQVIARNRKRLGDTVARH